MGRKAIDLTGQRFGNLTVVASSGEKDSRGNKLWTCYCDCSISVQVPTAYLRSGRKTHCGCGGDKTIAKERFGKLTAITPSTERDNHGNIKWKCECDCGNKVLVTRNNLNSGTESCGCLRIDDITGKRFGKWEAVEMAPHRGDRNKILWKFVCECGTTKVMSPANVKNGVSSSCGCAFMGENHPSYNPNLTPEERENNRYDLYGKNLRNWRRDVYFNDSHTCQGCGKHGGNLNAHHLNSWNAFPEQRFDTVNGITLCEDCHKEFHHFNGYGDNTLEEFRDYLACMVGEEHISEIEETLLSRESEIIGQEQPTRELQTI